MKRLALFFGEVDVNHGNPSLLSSLLSAIFGGLPKPKFHPRVV